MKHAEVIVIDAFKDTYKLILFITAALLAIMCINIKSNKVNREEVFGELEKKSEVAAPHFIMSNASQEGQSDILNLVLLRNLGLRPIL